jgi:D-alanine--poly(phosphoribitol) ligase subunit 1
MTVATFLPRFSRSCESHPDAIAFQFSDRSFTYREFGGLVDSIRRRLETTTPETERFVAVFATQDVWTYASIIAVLSTGRAYVPLNPNAPAERNVSCIVQSGTRLLLCSRATAAVSRLESDVEAGIRVIETGVETGTAQLRPVQDVSADSIAYLLFTSGSTGVPKGVPVYHRNLNCFLEAFVDYSDLSLSRTDRFLQMFDLTFDLSVMSFGVPLCLGAACCVVPATGPGFLGVAKTLAKGEVTVALMVPSVLTFLERYFDEIRLPKLRLSLFCGEALNARMARSWWACTPKARLLNMYGPTEATVFCSSYELRPQPVENEEYQGVVSIGRPMRGTEFRIVDQHLADVSPGHRGELVIMGGQVTDQYWNNPERTAAAFVRLSDGGRGYRSGDVVVRVQDDFFYCGRTDHQLKVDGYRVEAGEIEHHARLFDGVRDAALVGQLDANGKMMLVLFLLAGRDGTKEAAKDVREFLSARLPSYMVPHRVTFVRELPLNQNGKVDRKALARLAAET